MFLENETKNKHQRFSNDSFEKLAITLLIVDNVVLFCSDVLISTIMLWLYDLAGVLSQATREEPCIVMIIRGKAEP